MVNEIKTLNYEVFPTNIMRYSCENIINSYDKTDMINCADWMYDNKMWTDNELTPKYQTYTVLFANNSPPVWHKLRATFFQACHKYLEANPYFVQDVIHVKFTSSNAWCYKGWKSLNTAESNPWHDHNPAFLSGVYYLHDPGDGTSGGTEFFDPRKSEAHSKRMQQVEPMENTWIIFPGWLNHRTWEIEGENAEEPRYVIAANAFVGVEDGSSGW